MSMDEQKLAREFQQGSAQAFETLYHLYGQRIYRFCYRLCGSRADAEDLAQEVFVAAFQGRTRFEGRATLATWLYRIALYQWRRKSAPSACALPEEDALPDAQAGNAAQTSIENVALAHALAALPPALYEAFLLVKMEGLTYREAAAALNTPQGTLQYRVHEAVMRLRALLQEEGESQPVQGQEAQANTPPARASRPKPAEFQEQTRHAV